MKTWFETPWNAYPREAELFERRHYQAYDKAEDCLTTKEFIKHCHTLIHMCSEALSKGQPHHAECIYDDLAYLLENTTCTFN